MISIGDALKNRIESQNSLSLKEVFEKEGKEYQKRWAHGVQIFQKKINEERKRDGMSELPFMSIRMKLAAIKEIDNLRWFFGQCQIYEKKGEEEARLLGKKNEKTFGKCFFGALKIK